MAPVKKKMYSRWRAASLLGVYMLITLHIVHWLISKRTLAPLEFNEVLYSIHLGIITAGFIFMGLTMIGTLIFGRFFCSWGCHILALEDLSAWLLEKFRIKPKPVRSRAFFLVPVAAMLYLFVWPQVERLLQDVPAPQLHVLKAGQGWESFTTDNFWRNLPGIPVTLLTFFTCGFAIVYLMGTRSFCRYGCPYGVLFGIADRIAPGKIKLTGNCTDCGICTTVCSSHVLVHKEVQQFGKVVDTNCLKDLDCVAACPNDALVYGFTTPTLLQSSLRKKGGNYSFTLGEDISLGVFTLVYVFIFRGLYDAVPFLLAITIAVIFSYFSILFYRMLHSSYAHMGSFVLKQSGKMTRSGKIFAAGFSLLLLFSMHSAYVHFMTWSGERIYNQVVTKGNSIQLAPGAGADEKLDKALIYLEAAHRWGLWKPLSLERELASIYIFRKDYQKASVHLAALLDKDPGNHEARLRLAKILFLTGKESEAADQLKQIIGSPSMETAHDREMRAEAHLTLGHIEEKNGFFSAALFHYEAALTDQPRNPEILLALGVIYTTAGKNGPGEKYLLQCDSLMPGSPVVLNNLSVIYMKTGRTELAMRCLQKVVELQPQNVSAHYNLGMVLYKRGQPDEAIGHLRRTIEMQPAHLNAHIALANIFEETGNTAEAQQQRFAVQQLRTNTSSISPNPQQTIQ